MKNPFDHLFRYSVDGEVRRGLEAVLVARETEDGLAAGASDFEQQLSDSADQHVQLGALVRTQ